MTFWGILAIILAPVIMVVLPCCFFPKLNEDYKSKYNCKCPNCGYITDKIENLSCKPFIYGSLLYLCPSCEKYGLFSHVKKS